jgi:hypothetical protein
LEGGEARERTRNSPPLTGRGKTNLAVATKLATIARLLFPSREEHFFGELTD